MTKHDFLERLRDGLQGLPREDREERVTFYAEMIDDRLEEGCSEEDAVAAAGSVEEIVTQIITDTPFTIIAKQRITAKRRWETWEILLLVLGFPLWLPLVIAAAATVLSVYVSVWAVVIALWAVFGSLIGCVPGGAAASVVFICTEHPLTGAAVLGATMVCGGLSVFAFSGCKATTKGVLTLTKKSVLRVKSLFMKKGEV